MDITDAEMECAADQMLNSQIDDLYQARYDEALGIVPPEEETTPCLNGRATATLDDISRHLVTICERLSAVLDRLDEIADKR